MPNLKSFLLWMGYCRRKMFIVLSMLTWKWKLHNVLLAFERRIVFWQYKRIRVFSWCCLSQLAYSNTSTQLHIPYRMLSSLCSRLKQPIPTNEIVWSMNQEQGWLRPFSLCAKQLTWVPTALVVLHMYMFEQSMQDVWIWGCCVVP